MTAVPEEARPNLDLAAFGGRRVWVVGGTGVIGSAVVDLLSSVGASSPPSRRAEVTIVSRGAAEARRDLPNVQVVAGSIADPTTQFAPVAGDHVIYVAGVSSDYLSRIDDIVETQVVGLQRALAATPGDAASFVYLSSVRIYGRNRPEELAHEDDAALVATPSLDDIYDSHKRLGEALCLWHAEQRGLRASIARITNVYGAGPAHRSETAITDFVRQARTTGRLVIRGSPRSVRNWCHAEDVASGVLSSALHGQPGRAYNVGSEEHLSTREVADLIAAQMSDVTVTEATSEARPDVQLVSIERAKDELGYRPKHRFAAQARLVVADTVEALEAMR